MNRFMISTRHRPPRIDRLHQGVQPFYFVTFNTCARARILANPEVHAAFRQFCSRAQEHGAAVGRYVIMPDHVHVFAMMPRAGLRLEAWIKSLKCVLGKTLDGQGAAKPHWQEGFFDHLLRSGESYGEKWDYVRQNPVRAGLVLHADDWPFQGEIESIRF